MATLKELQNKRKELQTTNPNATMLDAKNAITPAISNAPVAQTVNDLGGDVANRQNTRNVATNQGGTRTPNGAIMNADGSITQTPESMNANAGSTIVGNQYDQRTPEQKAVGAPATPEQANKSTGGIVGETPATTTTPATPATTPTVTQATTPASNTNVNTGKTAIDIAMSDVENGTITSWDRIPGNIEYKSGNKGAVVAPPTPRQIAEQKKLTQYAGMSSQQFLDQMKTGQIPSTISSQLAQTNPEFQKAQQEYSLYVKNKTRNDTFQSVHNGLTGKESVPQTDPLTDITNKFMKLMGADAENTSYVEAFKNSLSNNEAVRTKTKELNAKQAEINEKIKARDDLLKQYKLTYKDTPLAILVSMAAQDAQPINEEIATLQSERDLLKSDLTYETELAKGEYDAMVKDMERSQTMQDTLMQAQLGLVSKQASMQMEADFARQQAYENLNDPATAISNVMEEYKKLGIPFTSTVQSRLAEFQASGKPLAQFLTEMTQNIQQSPGYKAYEAKKAGEGTSYVQYGDKVYKNVNGVLTETTIDTTKTTETKAPKWVQDINGNWYNENSSISPAEQIGNGTVDIGTGSLLDVLGKNVGTYTGNRGYDLAGNIGDPLPAGGNWKVIATDTAGEQAGSIFKPGKGAKPYGNTVIMEDENGNQIRYSHLQDIGVQQGDTLGFGSVVGTRGNTGHVLGANGETLTAEQLAQGRGAHVDIEIKDKNGRLLSNEEQKNYLAGIKKPESTQNLSIYRSYVEDGKLPSKDTLIGLGMTSQQFINNADAGYTQFLDKKAKEISQTYPTLDITYTPTFASNSATQKEKLNDSVTKIGDIDMRITKLKNLFDEYGTEVLPTKAKAEMEALRKQIILKAKEVENLGVLNGPDLGILEDLLPSTTGIISGIWNWDVNTKAKLYSIQSNYRNDAKTKAINYGAKINFVDDTVEKELADSF